MPKFIGRISDRGNWDENKMKEAVKNVMEGKLSVRQAADRYDVPIPRISLYDRLKVLKKGKEVAFYPKLGRFESTFSEKKFMLLYEHVKELDNRLMPLESNPVLLILDGHASHNQLAVIKYARNHHIHMLSTAPHTTHKLQPLDRKFFKRFKSAFATASSAWMRRNPADRITDYDIAALVDEAFSRSARCHARSFFQENMFNRFSAAHFLSPVPSTSHILSANEPEPSTSSIDLSKQLSPFPDASKKRSLTRARKTQRSEIITSSLYKKDVEKRQKSRDNNKVKAKQQKSKGTKKILKTTKNIQSLSKGNREEETECIICGETFEEAWIQYQEFKTGLMKTVST
ncbi:unnamed protein product [Parnassius mnemosyne]|uniref:HTH psq-type domain-containing protein n=1 Tax=Parnassius mnemosyne TaxID=213953 RepID=A0AAV1M9R7_9NEOP